MPIKVNTNEINHWTHVHIDGVLYYVGEREDGK